jgi:hypothetical protein
MNVLHLQMLPLLFVAACRPSSDTVDGAPDLDASSTVDSSVDLSQDGSDASLDATLPDGAPAEGGGTGGGLHVGAHAIRFYHLDAADAATVSAPMAVQPSGSLVIVGVGRGDLRGFALPTDNKNSVPFEQLGTTHAYEKWDTSGTALYMQPPAIRGADYAVTTPNQYLGFGEYDEITLAAIEVVEGARVVEYAWNQVTSGPLTSASVTTTGPATLIAFWWGDGYFYDPPLSQTATPDGGFIVIESNTQETNAFVQCAVAAKNVPTAGTYHVTWTAMPDQGAQMWLVAVQSK